MTDERSEYGGGDSPVEPARETTRQWLLRELTEREQDFEELQETLEMSARQLETELRHVERTVRRGGGKLSVTPPECLTCGFRFPGRETRHLHPPSRCPRCRGERIAPPRLRIVR